MNDEKVYSYSNPDRIKNGRMRAKCNHNRRLLTLAPETTDAYLRQKVVAQGKLMNDGYTRVQSVSEVPPGKVN